MLESITFENLKITAVVKEEAKDERDKKSGVRDGTWDVKKIDTREQIVELSNGSVSITKGFNEVLIVSVQTGQQPTQEELWKKAHNCIMSMGDIFYDPKEFGDLEWGLDDNTKEPLYEGDSPNDRLLNKATQEVFKLLLKEYGIDGTINIK